ncbi:MAG TPA: hypothetical protein VFJ97_03150 [Dermatophilaceae bacterium]|nr:hypothetical protein [Dermatophilaceae bacterium]
MYGKVTTAAGASGGTLAFTGVNTVGYLVAASVLIFAGLALLKLIPRHEA